MTPSRFPRRVYGVGSEPDPRFTLANERTFLAWIRTSLALLAGAAAVTSFDHPWPGWVRLMVGVVLGLTGLVGPGLFTLTFAYFIGAGTKWHVPGASFLLAAVLMLIALAYSYEQHSRHRRPPAFGAGPR